VRAAVAGGTGLVGRYVVERLAEAGHEPVVLARSRGTDLVTGDGLAPALRGCEGVIDVSNVTTARRAVSERFFDAATTHLRDAAASAGTRHYVLLSIVGVDRVGLGYYAGKRRQEEVLAAGAVPWTVLRATQFHEFADQFLDRVRGPVVPVPSMLSRPVAATEVAAVLIETLAAGPRQFAPELAGPEELQMVDMVRRVSRRRGERRLVLPVRLPGRTGRALAHGGQLPAAGFRAGTRTFAEHLAAIAPAADR
jgi:uncharacterized protein YbjT (DUF2867 family)